MRTLTGSDASKVPARIGNAAFFAPDIVTLPDSGVPPCISSLSKASRFAALFAPFVGRQGGDRKRVDFVSDQVSKATVNELVPGQWAFTFKLGCNYECLEVRIVVAHDIDDRSCETGLY